MPTGRCAGDRAQSGLDQRNGTKSELWVSLVLQDDVIDAAQLPRPPVVCLRTRHSASRGTRLIVTGMDPQLLITYRYLRMSLVAVLAMLAWAVLIQWQGSGEPLLTSISDYYWTPVRAVFVGALVALGIGMVVLKPDNELEDILLNIAGVLAPVVAFVPTPDVGTCQRNQDGDFVGAAQATLDGIKNNVPALLAAGMLAVLILLLFTKVLPEETKLPPPEPAARLARKLGFAAVLVLLVGAVAWFRAGGTSFECNAHYAAAFTLFGCIIGVAVLNAIGKYRDSLRDKSADQVSLVNRYSVIAFLMLVVLATGLIGLKANWDYWIMFIEAGVLVLFMTFWILQSLDLWNRGLRSPGHERSLLPK